MRSACVTFTLALVMSGCPSGPDCSEMPGAPGITPEDLDDGTVGVEYSVQLSSGYGDEDDFEVTFGSLPDGLELASDGLISGTPTMEGMFEFEVESGPDTSGAACPPPPASASYTLTINP